MSWTTLLRTCSLFFPIALLGCQSAEQGPVEVMTGADGGRSGSPAISGASAGSVSSPTGGSGGASSFAGRPSAEGGSPPSGGAGAGGQAVAGGGAAAVGGTAGASGGTGKSQKLRVIVSSDIGGTDNDDQQSMVHFLVYSDLWDVEGLIASPWGEGRTKDIFEAIDAYEKDHANLASHSADYPSPARLRAVTKQGAIEKAAAPGWGKPSEGSEWIAEVAKRPDPRPVWITVWGALDDVAQALHDHPEIEPKLRVYWIGGPNKKHSPESYPYVHDTFKKLWFVEANTTYRGFFNGGDQAGDLSNEAFPAQHISDHGALGAYFMSHRKDIKMGDTPAVLYTIDNAVKNPNDPTKAGWGGAFVPTDNSYPSWWTDNPDPSLQVGEYPGAKTVSVHREKFLRDFQARMDRCQSPK